MQRLWAPWRMSYIEGIDANEAGGGCFLCEAAEAPDNPDSLVFMPRDRGFAILNRFPYNNGHTLVAPREHVGELSDLDDETALALQHLVRDVVELYTQMMQPDGFNVGLNLGRPAGAGLPGHLHWHIVPRWNGDTNFMPVLGETKVIPQALDDLYAKIQAALAAREEG